MVGSRRLWGLVAAIGLLIGAVYFLFPETFEPSRTRPRVHEPDTVAARRPEPASALDTSAGSLQSLTVNGSDAMTGLPSPPLVAGTPVMIRGSLRTTPARWIWRTDGKIVSYPPEKQKDPWYQKNKDRTYPEIQVQWRRAAPDMPEGAHPLGFVKTDRPDAVAESVNGGRRQTKTSEGEIHFESRSLVPSRPGDYELCVVLREIPAHGDSHFQREKQRTHVLFAVPAQVVTPDSP
jgi:hypothetical protein